MQKIIALTACLALSASVAAAAPKSPSRLQVQDAWSRPAAAGTNGAGFFTLTNTGSRSERLVSVSSPMAKRVEMHQTSMANGVMSMEAIKGGVALSPGQTVAFEPGGKHLMILGLKSALRMGETLPLTFTLASGRKIAVKASVRQSPPPPSRPE